MGSGRYSDNDPPSRSHGLISPAACRRAPPRASGPPRSRSAARRRCRGHPFDLGTAPEATWAKVRSTSRSHTSPPPTGKSREP